MDKIWVETLKRLTDLEERVGRIELDKGLSTSQEPEPKQPGPEPEPKPE